MVKPGIAAAVALSVERADHGRDIGLEEAVADDHQRQADQQQEGVERIALALRFEATGRDLARLGAVARQQRDALVLIALDLQLRAIVDDELLRRVATALLDDLIALAVDHRVGLGRLPAEAQRQIAEAHQDRAELHRALRTQEAVGHQAADQRRQIDQRGEAAVEAGGGLVGKQEMLREVERQQRPHAVIAEALHRLGGEQPRKLARMAEPLPRRPDCRG